VERSIIYVYVETYHMLRVYGGRAGWMFVFKKWYHEYFLCYMYIMQVGGPPPPLTLKYTSHVGDPVKIVSLEERAPVMNEVNELLGNPNVTSQEKQRLYTYMDVHDRRNFTLLKQIISDIKTRLNPPPLYGGRRRRTRRNKSKKSKKAKKSMRRRR